MPFQSEKQRKYLWANEPEIAREWTDKYGSRVKKDNGGILSWIPGWDEHALATNQMKIMGEPDYHAKAGFNFRENFPNVPLSVADLLADAYQTTNEGWRALTSGGDWQEAMKRASEEARLNKLGLRRQGFNLNEYQDFMNNFNIINNETSPEVSIWDAIKNEFGGSAQAADLSGMIPKNLEKTIEEGMQSYKKSNEISPALRKAIEEGTSYNEWDRIPNEKYHGIPMKRISLNQDEEETFIDPHRIPGRIQKSVPRKMGILEKFRNRFYKPATSAAGGYNVSQLNKMNALGGYYSEPARQQRRADARRTNILNRAAKGKAVGNVNALLGKHGYQSTPGGGLQFTGQHEGSSTAGAGYSRSDSGWSSSPFRRGGLASLWQR